MFWLLNLQCRDEREKTISPSLFPSNFQSSQFVFHTRRCKGINWLFQQWTFFSPREINGAIFLLVCGARTSPRLTQKYANQKAFGIKIVHINPSQLSQIEPANCGTNVIIDETFHRNVYPIIIKLLSALLRSDTESVGVLFANPRLGLLLLLLALLQIYAKSCRGKQYGRRQHSTTQHQARK